MQLVIKVCSPFKLGRRVHKTIDAEVPVPEGLEASALRLVRRGSAALIHSSAESANGVNQGSGGEQSPPQPTDSLPEAQPPQTDGKTSSPAAGEPTTQTHSSAEQGAEGGVIAGPTGAQAPAGPVSPPDAQQTGSVASPPAGAGPAKTAAKKSAVKKAATKSTKAKS